MTTLEMKRALKAYLQKNKQPVHLKMNSVRGDGFRTDLRTFKLQEMGLDSAKIDKATVKRLKKWLPVSAAKKYKIQTDYSAITHGGWRRIADINQIVLHSVEGADLSGADSIAEAVGRMTESPSYGASPHFTVDRDSIQRHLIITKVGWQAAGDNTDTIGIEQAGFAHWSQKKWLEQKSELDRVAWLLAKLNKQTGIPLRFVNASGLRRNTRGVTTHAEVTKAWGIYGGHTDPGTGYPIRTVLAKARAYREKM